MATCAPAMRDSNAAHHSKKKIRYSLKFSPARHSRSFSKPESYLRERSFGLLTICSSPKKSLSDLACNARSNDLAVQCKSSDGYELLIQ